MKLNHYKLCFDFFFKIAVQQYQQYVQRYKQEDNDIQLGLFWHDEAD